MVLSGGALSDLELSLSAIERRIVLFRAKATLTSVSERLDDPYYVLTVSTLSKNLSAVMICFMRCMGL